MDQGRTSRSLLSNLRHSSLELDDLCCSSCVVVFALHVYATCILAAPYNDKRSEGRFFLVLCFDVFHQIAGTRAWSD